MSETNVKIFDDTLLTVDDKDAIPDMEEFFHESIDGIEGFRPSSIPSPQLLFKHDDKLVLHPELGVIEEDRDFR